MTGTGDSRAAISADSWVPLISADRCTDRISVAPPAAASAYTSARYAGAGREVLTGRNSLSASATISGVAPPGPSSYTVAPITTWSGTTTMPRAPATSGGNDAVESVTTAVPGMAGTLADDDLEGRFTRRPDSHRERARRGSPRASGSDDDVDQLRRAHDHPAHGRAVDGA